MEVSTDQRQSVQTGEVSSSDTQSPNNTQQCIVQCIFEKLEMVNFSKEKIIQLILTIVILLDRR